MSFDKELQDCRKISSCAQTTRKGGRTYVILYFLFFFFLVGGAKAMMVNDREAYIQLVKRKRQ